MVLTLCGLKVVSVMCLEIYSFLAEQLRKRKGILITGAVGLGLNTFLDELKSSLGKETKFYTLGGKEGLPKEDLELVLQRGVPRIVLVSGNSVLESLNCILDAISTLPSTPTNTHEEQVMNAIDYVVTTRFMSDTKCIACEVYQVLGHITGSGFEVIPMFSTEVPL